jgi:predicted membrane-bound dolichyl-phosphate-mannose-protein mannosyltransferase
MESRARIGAGLLLAAFATQAVVGMLPLSATWDEITHLPSGYSYLQTGEIVLNRQHPPLVKLLCALPLLALKPRADFLNPNHLESPGYEWAYGTDFLYRNDADRLLFWGRLPVVGLGTLLGLYVFLWAHRLFGAAGGLCSLALYAFCPSFLAHTHLVTMDVGLACFATMAFYHLWRDTRWHRVAAGAALGAALATKFSALAFLGVVVLLALVRRPRTPARLATVLAVAMAVVYLAYLLPSDPRFYAQGVAALHRDHQPGFQHYMLGEFRERFWSYFAVALAVKTPIPTLLALLAAGVLAVRGHRAGAIDEGFLLVPAAVFFAVTTTFADDLGVRYVLPVLSLLLIFAGRLGPWLLERRLRTGLGLALLAWLAWGTLRIAPDHLAYFNALAGGPENGWKVLDDSNIDWGQDLKRLKPWMERNGVGEIALLYTGNASPEYHGIRYRKVSDQEFREAPFPGWYAISVQALIRGRTWERTRGWHTDWMTRYRPAGRVGYSIYLFKFPAGTSAPL